MKIVLVLLKGGIIGIANIIPGVSGGTLALVLGLYERLITAIHNISLKTVLSFLKLFTFKKGSWNEFREEMNRIDVIFLILLTAGAFGAIVALANLMTYLLEFWHDPTYGFFFGLVMISIIAPYRLIKKKGFGVILSGLVAALLVLAVSWSVSGEKMLEKAKAAHQIEMHGSDEPINEDTVTVNTDTLKAASIFVQGAVAISAMILPGVSGSFLLLLMGGYFDILKAIAARDIMVLSIFALGCLFGILLFSRLLNFLLKRWHDQTMGFLIGLIVGSLWMIWPFKTTAQIGDETIYLSNTLPERFGPTEVYTVIAVIAGVAIVGLMIWFESRRVDAGTERITGAGYRGD